MRKRVIWLWLAALVSLSPPVLQAGVCELRVEGTTTVKERRCVATLYGPQCREVLVQRPGAWHATAVNLGRHSDGWIFVTVAHTHHRPTNVTRTALNVRGEWITVSRVLYLAPPSAPDLAVCLVSSPRRDLRKVVLASQPPSVGEALVAIGFPDDTGQPVRVRGTCTGDGAATMESPIVPGFSGGAVLNAQGDLVGIISASSGGEVCGAWGRLLTFVPLAEIRLAIAQAGLEQDTPAATELAETNSPIEPVERRLSALEQQHAQAVTILAQLDAKLTSEAARLDRAISTVATTPGPPGPAGASPDLSELRQQVAALRSEVSRLQATEFPVRTLRPDGSVFSEDIVRLGGPIEFRLVPKPR